MVRVTERTVPGASDGKAEDDASSAVAKALGIMEAFYAQASPLGLSEIARRAGVAKTSTLRVLRLLEAGGYVERAGTKYRLSWRVLELSRGARFCEPGGLRDISQPYLSELHQASGWSVNLAVLEGTDVLYLSRIHRLTAFRLPGGMGSRVPASCTGLGKAMLAFQPAEVVRGLLEAGLPALTPYSITVPRVLVAQLEQIRSGGLAYEREESTIGVACMAVPILHDGVAIAAISVSGRVERPPARPLDGLLRKAAASAASDYASALRRRLGR